MNNTSSTIIADTGLTPEEITTASRHLSVTRGFMLESVSGLSAAQWDFKPADDVWSIAENLEHVVRIESGVHGIIEGMSKSPETTPEGNRNEMDQFILNQIPLRSRKGKSPELRARPAAGLAPKHCSIHRVPGTEPEPVAHPAATRHVYPHPLFGPWDGYQWLLAGASHGARHTDQIREVKANSNFPAN